jgi:predicted DsbA family dithiol-disulfide isomerase
MVHAVERFHDLHPEIALSVNVTRHPYSFVGDRAPQEMRQGELDGIATSEESLRTFGEQMAGRFGPPPQTEEARRERMRPFLQLGAAAGISFDLEVRAQYQPVESQRLLLWAGRFGLQEPFMSAINKLHFEERRSASVRSTLLAAVEEVGLDADAAAAFLETYELEDEVWRSYGATIREAGIRAIPLFAFSVPALGAVGGPFRAAGPFEAYVVRGSSGEDHFLQLFELIARDAAAGARVYDEAAFPYRRDEWWAQRRTR